jgi:ribonuclease BN (tRNA processing enzyme)
MKALLARNIGSNLFKLILSLLVSYVLADVAVADTPPVQSKFITLGTNSGPIPNPQRAEASNALVVGKEAIVIDAGDAVTWQLSKAGISLTDVHAVFLSHLHFDHTGGLFALLSQRYQTHADGVITIYGPVGTQRTVDALINAMAPLLEDSGWILSKFQPAPAETVKVVELTAGSKIALDNVKVSASKNSHFILAEKEGENKVRSLSFRFDLPDRSIVYTGDTGVSDDVVALAKDADLLVTEVMDAKVSLERIQTLAEQTSPGVLQNIAIKLAGNTLLEHFEREHLSPEDAGRMASRANVKSLVITHNALPDELLDAGRQRIGANYQGPVIFATDLQAF